MTGRTTVGDVIAAIEKAAPPSLQDSWDNTGLQVGDPSATVTGVLTVVDVTPARIAEAIDMGANMIVSHHPLIFKGLKNITGATDVQLSVAASIRAGIAVYSSHTALDNAADGVSAHMAALIGATVTGPLIPSAPGADTGTGVVARLQQPLSPTQFVSMAKQAFGANVARCTDPEAIQGPITTVALCGGAGGSFIADAVNAGAQAYITGDVRYHDFVDWTGRLLVVDLGHFETERLTKHAFVEIIGSALPGLPVYASSNETNSVKYL